jgi:hypothetical protein
MRVKYSAMASSEKHATGLYTQTANVRSESPNNERPQGWRYRSFKIGPLTIPWYASPEAQLLLVSFVCFLCPGKTVFADATTVH